MLGLDKGNNIYYGDLDISFDSPKDVVEQLCKVQKFVGNLHIQGVYARHIPNLQLEIIDGNLVIDDCKFLWNFPNLRQIKGDAVFKNSYITGFESLIFLDGDLKLRNTTIVHLHNLKKIGKNVVLDNSDIIHALALETIGKDLFLNNATIVHVPELRYLNGKDFLGEPGVSITKPPSKTEDFVR